jgi:hypothetical protein
MEDENKCTALVKREPDYVEGEIVKETWLESAHRKRRELTDALRAGKVRDPISLGTLISIGVSAAFSVGSSPLMQALGKRKPRC